MPGPDRRTIRDSGLTAVGASPKTEEGCALDPASSSRAGGRAGAGWKAIAGIGGTTASGCPGIMDSSLLANSSMAASAGLLRNSGGMTGG
jgi:hypothetical protein